MPTDTLSAAAVRRIAFDRISAFPRLFQTYCSDYEALSEFYAGDFRDPEAQREAAARAVKPERDREALADVLLEQNEQWGLDAAARANIEQLRAPDAIAVVTGQQVGLFTGPLYTPYKTITALALTRRLAEETGRPVVPVFWVEGEDHNFEEVAGVRLLRRNEPVSLRYERPAGEDRQPVGRHVLTPAIEEVTDRLDEVLPGSDFKPRLMEAIRSAYRPGARLEDAFVHLMQALFPETGIVFINPDDARLKAQSASLFRRELEGGNALSDRVNAAGERLKGNYHAQVQARPTNLFLLEEEGRLALDQENGQFQLRSTDRTLSRADLLRLLEDDPGRFSPNVVLRPLMQDTLLPTAAYVAGPGEVSYFAQYRSAYEWAELPMPLIYPRASVTLVESKVQKVLDRYELSVPAFTQDLDRLFQQVALDEMEKEIDDLFEDAGRQLHKAINTLKSRLGEVDATLAQSAEATRTALMKEVDQLKSRVVRAEKRNQDDVRAQLEKARVNLFPAGLPQERALNALYFLNKYSPSLLGELETTLSLDTTAHQVVSL